MEELLTLVANVGFPIAVSTYLLVRLEAKMEALALSISKLTEILTTRL